MDPERPPLSDRLHASTYRHVLNQSGRGGTDSTGGTEAVRQRESGGHLSNPKSTHSPYALTEVSGAITILLLKRHIGSGA